MNESTTTLYADAQIKKNLLIKKMRQDNVNLLQAQLWLTGKERDDIEAAVEAIKEAFYSGDLR